MTPEQFETACKSLQCGQPGGYFGVVGVFGGNPCLHKDFEEICRIMRAHVPFEQRGLWSNRLFGHGAACRITFNPAVSNLNCHCSEEAAEEMRRDWPECAKHIKGVKEDSRHGPVFVAMKDVVPDEEERWRLIADCDISRFWSSMICTVRGELRGFFCEIAASMAMLHQNDPNWPDLGVPIVPGWWDKPIDDFGDQVRHYCHRCSVPLRGYGDLAVGGKVNQISQTHADAFTKLKSKDQLVQLVTSRDQLKEGALGKSTDYLENSSL